MSNAQPQSQWKQDLQIIRRSFLRMSAGAAAAAVATACTNANVGSQVVLAIPPHLGGGRNDE